MASPITAVETFTRARLIASSNITNLLEGQFVYSEQAPEGKDPPYIIISYSGSSIRTAYGAHTTNDILTNLIYLVKAVTMGNAYDEADKILDYVDEILATAMGQITENGIVFNVSGYVKQELIKLPPEIVAGGDRYNHVGYLYRVTVEKVSGTLPVVPAP